LNLYSISSIETINYEKIENQENRRAIIIGINKYESDTQIPTLSGAENDAKEIYERLKDPDIGNFEIFDNHYLLGQQATRKNILRAVSEIFRQDIECDLIFFYFSGHAFLDYNNDLYLAPYDMVAEDPIIAGINIRHMNEIISSSINKRNVVLIYDCMFSDRAADGLKVRNSEESRFVLAASRDGVAREITIPHTTINATHTHGTMSFFLIEGLYGKARDENGYVTLGSLYKYIEKNMLKNKKRPLLASIGSGNTSEEIKIVPTFYYSIDTKNYYKKSHAVIIGISEYKEENQLPNAYNDAIAIKKVLQEKYSFDNTICLFNEEATNEKLHEIFIDTLRDPSIIGPDDRILVYYAGHGKLKTITNREGQEVKTGYIIPYDAKKDKYSSYLEMETIVDCCTNSPAKHVLLILDCCYSGYAATRGDIIKPTMATDFYLKQITTNTAYQILAAGEKNQPVADSGIRKGNSAFTGALLDILESEIYLDNDGILTASEIGTKLGLEVARQSRGGVFQRPVFNNLYGSGLGDFVFKIFNTK
jgi:uncharacterized caspase-like protein